jgi:hypothetical protein
MSGHVISHRRPRRKRSWGGFVLRRFGALAVTLAALGSASWLAPSFYRSSRPEPTLEVEAPPLPAKAPPPVEIAKAIDRMGEVSPVVQARQTHLRRRGVPLDANPGQTGEDYEVLSAAELDGISQARN